MPNHTLEELGLSLLFSLPNAAMTADMGIEVGRRVYLQAHLRSDLEVYRVYRDFPLVAIDVTMPVEILFPTLIEEDGIGRTEPTPPWRAHSNTGELEEEDSFPRDSVARMLAPAVDPFQAVVLATRMELAMEQAIKWLEQEGSAERIRHNDSRYELDALLKEAHDTRMD